MKARKNKTTANIMVRDISRALHNEFKALCAGKGVTMNEEMIRLIANRVKPSAATPQTETLQHAR